MNFEFDHLRSKGGRKLLQLIYGFEEWHLWPLKERAYALDLIDYLNARTPRDSYVEIGCGLGDIVRRADYKKRWGFDNNIKVIRAARLMPVKYGKRKDVKFAVFHFPETELSGTYSVISLVNWIHHIESDILRRKIEEYFNNNIVKDGEIIIDTVKDPSYKYNHNIQILTNGLNCSIHKIGSYDRGRELWSIKKLN